MREKKKSGSALVLVLIFTLIFTVISGVTVLAVVGSFKANTAEEKYESLYYEADAGIEMAMANANAGKYDFLDVPNEIATFDIDDANMIGKVNVVIKYTGDLNPHYVPGSVIPGEDNEYIRMYLLTESTSTSRDNPNSKRTVKAKLMNTIVGGNLFKYTICGEIVSASSSGALSGQGSNINSSTTPPSIIGAPSIIGDIEESQFELPDLGKMISGTTITVSGEEPKNILDKLDLQVTPNGPVCKGSFDLEDGGVLDPYSGYKTSFGGNIEYTVYLVKADLVIDLNSASVVGETKWGKGAIIVCTGDVTIKGDALTLTYSSILAKKINANTTGAFTIAYPPYDKNKTPSYSPLTDADIAKVNQIIDEKSNNWFSGAGIDGSGSGYEPGSYE